MKPFLLVVAVLVLSSSLAHAAGPIWTVRDIDTFQDNFASDGTTTGTVRADMAADILPPSSPGIQPGDSSVVTVSDPTFSLANDLVLGGKAVYCYVAVYPLGQPTKTGAGISGGARWPYAGTEVISGISWTKLRLDQSDLGGGPVPDNFCVDLNDNLFTPCDTIFFFYGAKSDDGPGTMSYFSLEFGTTSDITIAAALPMEFTCLPAGGWKRGGAVLYIDGAEGTDSQTYAEFVFRELGPNVLSQIDRYDVRGPADGANNRLASRLINVQQQLNDCYAILYWECDSLSLTLGDGSGTPQKTDDYGLINTFLGNLTNPGMLMLFGDDVGEQLNASTSPSATAFKQLYMPFFLVSGDHHSLFGAAPIVVPRLSGWWSDSFMAYGHAPDFGDFDVFQASAGSFLELTYGPLATSNGAVIGNKNGNAAVVMSGIGLRSVRDDDTDGVLDRAKFWQKANRYNGAGYMIPPTGAASGRSTWLAQNYPNPFNPVTTIAFSLATRGPVRLAIYDVNGALVRGVVNETRNAGGHAVTWDGRDERGVGVASGVYFYRLTTPTFAQTRKMVLLK